MLLFLLGISRVRARITARVEGLKGSVRVQISAVYGLVRFEASTVDRGGGAGARPRGAPLLRRWRKVRPDVSGGFPVMVRAARSLLSKATCTRLVMNARIGTGEASSTAISTGLAWEAVGVGVAFARESVGKWECSPIVNISPSFIESRVDLDLDCILEIRLGHAMIAIPGLARDVMQADASRRGDRVGRTPDSGPDEDCHGEHQGHG